MKSDFIAIKVREDNYMYLFFKGDIAFCIDPYEPETLLHSLGIIFTKKNYTSAEILQLTQNRNPRKLIYSFTTHSHFDHSGGNKQMKILSPDTKQISGYDELICKDEEKIVFEGEEIECIYTPCHTQDSFCYYIGGKYLITGDTIFFLGCGRFFEGSAKDMIKIIDKLKEKINKNTILLYGHDYNYVDTAFAKKFYDIPKNIESKKYLTFQEECEFNPFFNLEKLGIEGTKEEVMAHVRKLKDIFKI